MSVDIISRTLIKKVKIKQDDEKIKEGYVFYIKSHSSNTTPKTPYWSVMGIFQNENDIKSYIQNWFGSIAGGSLQFQDSNYGKNNFETYLNFFNKINNQLKKADYILNKFNGFTIDEEHFSSFDKKSEILILDEKYFEDIESFQKLDNIFRIDLNSSIEETIYNSVLGSSWMKNEDVNKAKEKFLLKKPTNRYYDSNIEDFMENIAKFKKNGFTKKYQEIFFNIMNNEKINESLKKDIKEYFYNTIFYLNIPLEEEKQISVEVFNKYVVDYLTSSLNKFDFKQNVEELFKKFPHQLSLMLENDFIIELKEILEEKLENYESLYDKTILNGNFDFFHENYANLYNLNEVLLKSKNKKLDNEKEIKTLLNQIFMDNIHKIKNLSTYSNGSKPTIVKNYINNLISNMKGYESNLTIKRIEGVLINYENFNIKNFKDSLDIKIDNLIENYNINNKKEIVEFLNSKKSIIVNEVEGSLKQLMKNTTKSFKNNEKISKEISNIINKHLKEHDFFKDTKIGNEIGNNLEIYLNELICNKNMIEIFKKISVIVNKYLLDDLNVEIPNELKKTVATIFGLELNKKQLNVEFEYMTKDEIQLQVSKEYKKNQKEKIENSFPLLQF